MSNNKNTGGLFGKGYYITLILCAAAIGIAGFLYYRNADDTQASVQNDATDAVVAGAEDQEDVAVGATQGSAEESAAPSDSTTAPTERKSLKTGAPVSGETVAGYAMETLSYNETTRDWRTHAGLDIAAEAGTAVLAAADGEVYTVYADETMGTTVVIRHDGGYTTQYSSLAEEVTVAAGDTVKLGQQIGTVGTTALLESALGEHVHFCVLYQDEAIDPAEFLAMS